MTAQIPDKIEWGGQHYYLHSCLQRYASPHIWKIQCIPMHTGCFRGYHALFAIRKEQLYLLELTLRTSAENLPAINGRLPNFDNHDFHYKDIMLPVLHTGKVSFGKDFDTNYMRTDESTPFSSARSTTLMLKEGRLTKSGVLQRFTDFWK